MHYEHRPPESTLGSDRQRRRWLLAIFLAAILCVLAYLATNIWRDMSVTRDKRAVEALIGTPLPEGIADFHYYRWEPGEELAIYTVYIKFSASEQAFRDLVGRLDMDLRNSGGADLMFLPAAWEAEPDIVLSWWDPSEDTPTESAATNFGEHGWIVAKFEDGQVYMIVTDSDFFD